MQQFVIHALDHADALPRRLENREAHLAGLKKLAQNDQLHAAGVMLNDNGDMMGSSVHVSFADRNELENWLETEPYVLGKVWNSIDIQTIKVIPVDDIKNLP